MKDFNEQYKEFYKNIKASNELKEKIINDTLNSSSEKISNKKIHFTKPAFLLCSFLAICLIGTSIVFAKNIIETIKSYIYRVEEKDNSSHCFFDSSINENINLNFDLNDGINTISKDELEQKLGIHILSNKKVEGDYYSPVSLLKNENKLAYGAFVRNTISANEIYENSWQNAKMTMSFSFITPYATEQFLENNITSSIFFNCHEEEFDIVTIESLGIDVYFVPIVPLYNYDIEYRIKALFIYDNLQYSITGEFVTRDMIIDFIKGLK